MLSYIIRRLLLLPPTLIGITAVVFFIVALSPGGIGASLLSAEGNMRPQERALRQKYLNERYGLDRPYLVQYLHWLNNVSPIGFAVVNANDPRIAAGQKLRAGDVELSQPHIKWPDLGTSFTRNRPVSAVLAEALPITMLLEVLSVPLIYALAIVTGVLAAYKSGKTFDIATGVTQIGLFSVPTIWVAVLFINFLCSHNYYQLFPVNGLHDLMADNMAFLPRFTDGHFQRGWLLDVSWHLIGPVFCLSYGSIAVLSKLSRGALLDVLNLDYVRTARAKGLSEPTVVLRHAFRNSLLPLITAAASILPGMIVGSVVVETVFGINGTGKLFIDAVESRDRELFLSNTLLVSILTLVSYLLADILYAVADPRVTYDA